MAKRANRTAVEIPYTPDEWTPEQLAAHRADTMEEAFRAASCLAAGWYRRAVTIDWQATEDNNERYMVRPAEVAPLPDWTPCYTVSAHVS